MALISISGVGRAKKKATPKTQKKAERKAKVQAKKRKILATIKKVGKIAIKYNPLVATARNSFLVLVQLNVFNLAKRLNVLLVKDPRKLMKFWNNLSGNFSSLQKAINSGKSKKAILGAVAVATSVATATPILVKVTKFLKDAGIGAEEIKAIKQAVIPIIGKAVERVVEKKAQKEVAKEEGEEVEEEEEEEETTTPAQTNNDNTEDTDTENEQVGYYC